MLTYGEELAKRRKKVGPLAKDIFIVSGYVNIGNLSLLHTTYCALT